MNELQKKYIDEGFNAFEAIENAIRTFKIVKKQVVESQKYEEASQLMDLEKKFKEKLFSLIEINIK